MRAKAAQGGFTLIELVVVITILGILAAFAVPRFVSLEGEARQASAQALGGSVRAAAALAHALALATGENGATGTVTMEGVDIDLVNGYPDAATIDDALSDFTGYAYTPGTGSGVFDSDSLATCTVTYTEAAANGAPGVTVSC
jgi:MSHA pilin protein MshA